MSKELKKLIAENRAAFDDDLPASANWQQVERAIRNKKPVKQIPVGYIYKWSAAAAVFFIIAAAVYFAMIKKQDSTKDIAFEKVSNSNKRMNNGDISRIDPAFAAEAKKMFHSIEAQQKQLKSIASEQPELYSQFSADLAALDSSYRVLKTQALQTPNREVIIRAMLQNLQLQAELLAKQLQVLQDFKTDKTQQNEKINYPRL